MKAIFLESYGSLDELKYGELPDPIPGEGEVVVDVNYAGVNFPDVLIVPGLYQFKPDLPFSPGGEVSGRISAIGDSVTHLAIGDRVMAVAPFGGYAEKMKVSAGNVYQLPEEVNDKEAAILQETYATAIHALKDKGRLKPGERLLVLGAAGGTGIAALQIGKEMGAEVIAAASTKEKLEMCRKNGADHLINYKEEDLKSRLKDIGGVDVIFDPVGGDHAEQAFRGIRPDGRHLIIGFTAGKIPALPWNLPLLKQASIVGVFWGGFWRVNPEGNRRNVEQLIQWLKEERIKPQIDKVLPLEKSREALEDIIMRKVKGKIVLSIA